MKKIIAVALCIVMIMSVMPFTFAVSAEEYGLMSEVYVSASGNAHASGLANDPCTIERAFVLVKDGGTIYLDGTVAVSEGFSFYKGVTIIGDNKNTDILDLSAMPGSINLSGDTAFDYVTLKFADHAIYANGNALTVGENCATVGTVSVYGAGNGGSVEGNTSVTLLSGKYNKVYGGGNLCVVEGNTSVIIGGTADVKTVHGGGYGNRVNGSTYVWVGGNANPDCDPTLHEGDVYYIIGGAYSGIVEGSTTVVFGENANANYIIGGMDGADQYIGQGSNLYITGGKAMSAYGGSAGKDQGSDVNVVMTGGELEQLMGAGSGRADVEVGLTGNVNIKLLGGEVSRRVFGGCYNEVDLHGNWTTTCYVDGEIELVIGSGVDVTFTYTGGYIANGNDHALSAHSRTNSIPLNDKGKPVEKATILYVDEPAMNKHSKNVKSGPNAGTAAYDSVQVLSAGDANLDGEITNADVLVIMKNIYNAEANPVLVFALADVNGDGQITNVDLLKVYKQIYAAQ